MKHTILTGLALVALASCSTPNAENKEKKARDLVTNYLKQNLADPSSYSSVKFEPLWPNSTTYMDTHKDAQDMFKETLHLQDSIEKYGTERGPLSEVIYEDIAPNDRLKTLYQAKKDSVKKLIKEKEAGFKPQLIDYRMGHIFRYKNKLGNLVLDSLLATFDTNCSRITKTIGRTGEDWTPKE